MLQAFGRQLFGVAHALLQGTKAHRHIIQGLVKLGLNLSQRNGHWSHVKHIKDNTQILSRKAVGYGKKECLQQLRTNIILTNVLQYSAT